MIMPYNSKYTELNLGCVWHNLYGKEELILLENLLYLETQCFEKNTYYNVEL